MKLLLGLLFVLVLGIGVGVGVELALQSSHTRVPNSNAAASRTFLTDPQQVASVLRLSNVLWKQTREQGMDAGMSRVKTGSALAADLANLRRWAMAGEHWHIRLLAFHIDSIKLSSDSTALALVSKDEDSRLIDAFGNEVLRLAGPYRVRDNLQRTLQGWKIDSATTVGSPARVVFQATATPTSAPPTLTPTPVPPSTSTPTPLSIPNANGNGAITFQTNPNCPIDFTDSSSDIEVLIAHPVTETTDAGIEPDYGNQFLYLGVREIYHGSSEFLTSEGSFELTGQDGTVYPANAMGSPADWTGSHLGFVNLPPNGATTGWVGFQVPQGEGTYNILWQDSILTGWQTVGTVHVQAHGPASVAAP